MWQRQSPLKRKMITLICRRDFLSEKKPFKNSSKTFINLKFGNSKIYEMTYKYIGKYYQEFAFHISIGNKYIHVMYSTL